MKRSKELTSICAKIVAILVVFFVGVISLTACSGKEESKQQSANGTTSSSQGNQKLLISVPEAEWEPFFFKSLEKHTRKIGLPSLRTVVLPNKDDLEVRLWIDRLPDVISGITLQRISNKWSAERIYGTSERQGFPITQEKLPVPKSGWHGIWEKLEAIGILTLPDASKSKCDVVMLDGSSIIIETNYNWSYRTYHYSNPQRAECDEAKRVISIIQILFDEFSLDRL